MAIPSISDFQLYIGTLLNNNNWNANFTKVVNYLSNGTYDFVYNSFTVSSNSSMGNARILNVGTPTVSTDAANKAYVDNNTVPRGYINGYLLSIDGTNPHTVIDVSAGICQNSANTQAITLSIAFKKNIATAWSAGTGNGSLDTGTIAATTTYYLFAIAKADGTTDLLSSTSATNPALPSGYTVFRQVGIFTTDSNKYPSTVYSNSTKTFAPDYSSGISKTWGTTYTAECDGWVNVHLGVPTNSNVRAYFYVNSIQIGTLRVGANTDADIQVMYPVSEGDIYSTSSGGDNPSLTFYPTKGVN